MSWNLRQIAVPMPPMPPVTYATLLMVFSLPDLSDRSAFARECHAHAAADAQRRQTLLCAAPLHLVQQAYQDATSGCADRVAQGDRAAVDVDLRRIPAHFLVDGAGLRGERLVDFHHVQVGRFPVGLRK